MSINHRSLGKVFTILLAIYILCAVHYIPMAYLFYNWKFVPLIHLHLFTHSPPLPVNFEVNLKLFLKNKLKKAFKRREKRKEKESASWCKQEFRTPCLLFGEDIVFCGHIGHRPEMKPFNFPTIRGHHLPGRQLWWEALSFGKSPIIKRSH